MYDFEYSVLQRIKGLISETEKYINLLYSASCIYNRSMLLNQLKDKMAQINHLSDLICRQDNIAWEYPKELPMKNQINRSDITLQELTKFNGKDGNPAYIAVNGVVYDVTENAAWAAATHFGLTAGKDLTGEFFSCHKGQNVLDKLKVVGKLIQ